MDSVKATVYYYINVNEVKLNLPPCTQYLISRFNWLWKKSWFRLFHENS